MDKPKTPFALIAPFNGIHYAASEVSSLVCPPYDIISRPEQEALYRKDPRNFVRLEFPLLEEPGGPYEAAAQTWQTWRNEKVFREDNQPSMYVLKTDFMLQGESAQADKPRTRLGFFAGVHLEPLKEGRILPHEGTLAAAKADRLALLKATTANFSPIWMIYHNPEIPKLLQHTGSQTPLHTAKLDDGSDCTLWRIDDPAVIEQIRAALGEGPLFIADGHHRYETALTHAQQEGMADGDKPINYVLSLLVEADDPGLVILPTYRAISGIGPQEMEKLWAHLEKCCQLEKASSLGAMLKRVHSEECVFGLYTKAKGCWLLKPEATSSGLESIPVKLLHKKILEPVLCENCKFGYFKDAEEAQAAVDCDEYQAAFFLRSLRSEELMQAALSKERLPGKSTYFWPKIPAGLVARAIKPS